MIAKRCPRRAYTLIEVLVVIGVIGMLVGLLMSAVQSARGAAARIACTNNLKQIALAAHMHHDAHGAFPAGYERLDYKPIPPAGPITGTLINWPSRLLPYLDQQALWDRTVAACLETSNRNLNPPHIGLATVLKVYMCPADGRLTAPLSDDRGYTAAYGSYEGVDGGSLTFMHVGNGHFVPKTGNDGAIGSLRGIRLAEITDGASSTLLFGDKPPWGRYLGGTWYHSIISDPSIILDPNYAGGAIVGMHIYSENDIYGCRGPFRFGPGRITNRCDSFHFWSLHHGGANFALCDGSVRFIPYSAEPVMVPLATRAGGEVVAVP